MRHHFSKILTLYYIAINLEISDFEMSDKFLDPSIASHEVLLNFCVDIIYERILSKVATISVLFCASQCLKVSAYKSSFVTQCGFSIVIVLTLCQSEFILGLNFI